MRVLVIIATSAVCVGAGATAGPLACASVLEWPLSEINLKHSVGLGLAWGVFGALLAAVVLSAVDRKRLWVTAGIAVTTTWLITLAGVWWYVVSSLG
jgi:hypothetical protein